MIWNGGTVGHVIGISPGSAGSDSQVSVQIDHQYTGAVHADAILALQGAGTTPSLEVMNPDPSNAKAIDNALLYGASNPSQTQLLVTSLGTSITNSYVQFLNRYASPQPSPAAPGGAILQNQLTDLLRQTLAATGAITGSTQMGRTQIDEFRQDADAVARQLEAHGRATEAAQLRAEAAQLSAAAATTGPPGTLTVPRAAPTP